MKWDQGFLSGLGKIWLVWQFVILIPIRWDQRNCSTVLENEEGLDECFRPFVNLLKDANWIARISYSITWTGAENNFFWGYRATVTRSSLPGRPFINWPRTCAPICGHVVICCSKINTRWIVALISALPQSHLAPLQQLHNLPIPSWWGWCQWNLGT